uniref:ABC-type transporter Mla maintaining outer membrane lipid asymmetry, MlaB component, contains STAS domain n=1 Tax=Candidatus Kentrum sp. TC TaxID=2126339 RepID=A0A451A3R6_9GAMM|nr:MAG: ABC-type transporter Mla maintaining outer membrane lipid asymmetry, MlaB component, contains STAS domain [Candidatus Kentron sp. TC]VFK48950.1 MAG: ABC-type transporter Mla maintaining outer membrane lipid asymmetry, MlaB component, contains STAS domain [Candidatus Kentron sp. TC]VFK60674.1 MAG: ABC-type transporter Mla maintaining outer membrane lipid asymmetry, MlaB component, contains STAS domain [Candidatus Kentron sp. TC]
MIESVSHSELRATGKGKISLSGELTFISVPGLLRKGKNLFPDTDKITLDLGEVVHSDSAGLALMVEWLRQSKIQNKTLEFQNIPKQMLSLAKTAGIGFLLDASENFPRNRVNKKVSFANDYASFVTPEDETALLIHNNKGKV